MELQNKQTVRIPMDDDKIVELYWERDEKAIEETDFKYKKYLFSIAYNKIIKADIIWYSFSSVQQKNCQLC